MAEALFVKLLKDIGKDQGYSVTSSGLAALEGMPAAENAQKVLQKKYGIDLSSHRAKLFSEELLAADLILTMTKLHKDHILNFYPRSKGNVYTLGEFLGEDMDIADPYGGNEEVYEEVAKILEEKLKEVITRLEKN